MHFELTAVHLLFTFSSEMNIDLTRIKVNRQRLKSLAHLIKWFMVSSFRKKNYSLKGFVLNLLIQERKYKNVFLLKQSNSCLIIKHLSQSRLSLGGLQKLSLTPTKQW